MPVWNGKAEEAAAAADIGGNALKEEERAEPVESVGPREEEGKGNKPCKLVDADELGRKEEESTEVTVVAEGAC